MPLINPDQGYIHNPQCQMKDLRLDRNPNITEPPKFRQCIDQRCLVNRKSDRVSLPLFILFTWGHRSRSAGVITEETPTIGSPFLWGASQR